MDRIAVVGSRNWKDLLKIKNFIDTLDEDTVVISGGAIGVDRDAEWLAKQRGLLTKVYPADWKKYGRSAGIRRNNDIVKMADRIAAFWDGESKGTYHTICLSAKAGKPLLIFLPKCWL